MTTQSSAPLKAALVAAAAVLAACEPGPPDGVDESALAAAIGASIGDPATCVILAEAGSGKILYRYEALTACTRALPTCAQPPSRSTEDLAKLAASGHEEQSTCGGVSWAAGSTPREGVVYAAVMEGERALPGREIAYRLERVFQATGF